MTAAKKFPDRAAMLAKVHMAKKALGLDDDSYRAVTSRITGKDSSGACNRPQLVDLLDEFTRLGWKPPRQPNRAGKRPMAADPQSAKIRALWLALYHLGTVRDPAEAALTAFAKRMTGVSALQWLNAAQGNKVIEALKEWCVREGFSPSREGAVSKQLLLQAQWGKLATLGAVRIADTAALDCWLTTGGISPCSTVVQQLSDGQLDQAAEKLGAWVRQAVAKAKEKANGAG
jgi:phage gp16-like protein